jgi:hypothetical protein
MIFDFKSYLLRISGILQSIKSYNTGFLSSLKKVAPFNEEALVLEFEVSGFLKFAFWRILMKIISH